MQRISVYIPNDTRKMIHMVAKAKSKAEAEVIRAALAEGLKVIHPTCTSAQALLTLASLAEQIPTQEGIPNDAVSNMDYYTWGGTKRE